MSLAGWGLPPHSDDPPTWPLEVLEVLTSWARVPAFRSRE